MGFDASRRAWCAQAVAAHPIELTRNADALTVGRNRLIRRTPSSELRAHNSASSLVADFIALVPASNAFEGVAAEMSKHLKLLLRAPPRVYIVRCPQTLGSGETNVGPLLSGGCHGFDTALGSDREERSSVPSRRFGTRARQRQCRIPSACISGFRRDRAPRADRSIRPRRVRTTRRHWCRWSTQVRNPCTTTTMRRPSSVHIWIST